MTFAQRSAADHAADAEFITAVRGGDTAAYASLYERHRAAAYHLARQLTGSPSEADDLVSDAFTKVFHTLLAGGGPDSAFRAYLLTSVRNTFYDGVRRGKKVTYTDDMAPHDEGQPFVDTAVAGLDNAMAARAFAKLPERWQTVLWHTEVEGESPAQVAPILGLTANAAAALAYRAREGLRQAFLQEHIADVAAPECKVTTDRLGAWARGGLSKRELSQVERHLDECDRCAAVATEISDLGAGLRGVVAVLAIGSAPLTAAYLAGGSTAKIAALAWAGAGAPAAGFAKISALISATPTATTTTATAGAFVPGTESSSASASNATSAAGHSSRGLIGAIAGTAAVAAIATAVIVGSSYDDPKPSAKDGGLGTTSSAPAKPSVSKPGTSAAPPAAPSATDSSVPGGGNRTPYSGNIADLPAIPPVISESIPGVDPIMPPLPAPSAPAPQPTNPGSQPTNPDGGDTAPTKPTTENPEPTTTNPSEPQPSLGDPVVTPTPVINLKPAGSPGMNLYSVDVTIQNQGTIGYSKIELEIPAFGAATGVNTVPATCSLDVIPDATLFIGTTCGAETTSLEVPLSKLPVKAGASITFTFYINLGTERQVTSGETFEATFTPNDEPSAEENAAFAFGEAPSDPEDTSTSSTPGPD